MRKYYSSVCKPLFLWTLIGLFHLNGFAQNVVTGKITDTNSGEGLPGANVLIKGTTNGTVTDVDGNFSLNATSEEVLVISSVGYITQEIPVGAQTSINVTMSEDLTQLEELVVIGYGEKSKKLLTESVASVKSEEIQDLQVTSIESAIQGKVPGISVLAGSGQPGTNPQIRVRQGSSMSRSNDPLYVIDGVIRDSQDFNPDDAASVEVLKDAAAAAIYGSRASNGVILITTKQGTKGKARFNASYRKSWSKVENRLDLLNSEEYLQIERVGLTRSFLDENSAFGAGANATGTGNAPDGNITTRILQPGETPGPNEKTTIDPITGETLVFQDNDWQDEVYTTSGIDNFSFGVDGGSDKITYYLGTAYVNQEGIAKTTSYQRFSLQSNLNFQLTDKLKATTNVNFTRSVSDEPQDIGLMFGRIARLAPTARLRFDDGTLAPGIRSSLQNPTHYTQNYLRDQKVQKITLGAALEYEIIPGLIAKVYGSYFNNQDFVSTFTKSNFWTVNRDVSSAMAESRQTIIDGTLTYTTSVGDHNFAGLIGASRQDTKYFDLGAAGFGGSTDDVQTVNGAATITNATSFEEKDLLIGVFGRISYDYNGKYLLAATLRRDGSSRFPTGNQIGYFPSVSAGWRIIEESFFSSSLISDLKLRASWGQTGNNDTRTGGGIRQRGFFDAQGLVNTGFTYNSQAAGRATALANSGFTWETTTQTNIGFDVGLLDDRFTLSLDWYKKLTEDEIFSKPLPNTSGFDNITENIGSSQRTGIELGIGATILEKDDLSWYVDFNIAFTDNEVVDLADNELDRNRIGGVLYDDGTGVGGLAEGEPLGQIVGWKFQKVYATTQEAQEDGQFFDWANDRTNNNGIDYRERVGGDVKWLDTNGDNIIDDNDQIVLGNSIPDIVGGLSNTFTFKGFELYLFVDWALGHSIYNHTFARMNSNSQGNINGTGMLRNAWNEEGDVTDVPRFVFFDFGNARNHDTNFGTTVGQGAIRTGSHYVEKGDYLAIRTVRLSYNLPDQLIGKTGLTSAKLYLSGQNLHYFTSFRGYNPESVDPADSGRYPISRILSLGVDISF
ncbi:MAG: SusC/RagA family TonB-linked outer membrane protein [Cyclobacteriaceae bacterium]|nr:MAG: SusC/RagA family TonB-linked outer membrane protein [Cyclobacteriaceae bacterium]